MKKIAITGANGNIGAGLAHYFADKGYEVIALTRADIDLTSETPFTDFFARNPDFTVDYWINNAATQTVASLKEMTQEDVLTQFKINTLSIFNLYYELAKKKYVTDSVLNISSVEAINARPGHSHYGASKAALDSLTRSAAVELAPLRSNSLRLGLIHREGIENAWPQGVNAWIDSTPLQRMGTIVDIGQAAEFLLTSTFTTGAHITVDGGNTVATNW
jgi:NAD(P)-dependent dehydrogenase (short-subunit alcohol dehydrogenase family)